jgi:hypothetical protein
VHYLPMMSLLSLLLIIEVIHQFFCMHILHDTTYNTPNMLKRFYSQEMRPRLYAKVEFVKIKETNGRNRKVEWI